MIQDDQVMEVVHVSTGKLGTPTGRGRVFRKDPGWVTVPVGQMYSPSYIMPHIAIHGSKSVPNYPASHGCVRTPIWITDHLYDELPMGLQVDIYY
jgi:lipoprotein-anchoring transpeptidase ErfK/SrfK